MTPLPDRLPDADWRQQPGIDRLLEALDAGSGGARYVGGAVRDALVGLPVKDVDIATPHHPQDVLARLAKAGLKAVPTGIEHGTITAIVESRPFEVTTLRRDVSTDGRHATVAFSTDWKADADRRDFTINALYADPFSGALHDYHDGLADLVDGRVRFIGSARARIAEDHLRILRYFRFLARFGNCGAARASEDYAACTAAASSLKALSRERVADELLKLLAVDDPLPAVRLMIEGGIFVPIIPEITPDAIERLERLVAREKAAAPVPPAPLRRLSALLPRDPAIGDSIAARLKLSNRARKRISAALSPAPAPVSQTQLLAYKAGAESAIDLILLDKDGDPATAQQLLAWERPILPFGGGQLIQMGLGAGPLVSRALHAIEAQWMEEGFPGGNRPQEIADQIVSKFQRADQ